MKKCWLVVVLLSLLQCERVIADAELDTFIKSIEANRAKQSELVNRVSELESRAKRLNFELLEKWIDQKYCEVENKRAKIVRVSLEGAELEFLGGRNYATHLVHLSLLEPTQGMAKSLLDTIHQTTQSFLENEEKIIEKQKALLERLAKYQAKLDERLRVANRRLEKSIGERQGLREVVLGSWKVRMKADFVSLSGRVEDAALLSIDENSKCCSAQVLIQRGQSSEIKTVPLRDLKHKPGSPLYECQGRLVQYDRDVQDLRKEIEILKNVEVSVQKTMAKDGLDHTVSKEQCEEIAFDNRAFMSDETDQKRSSLCWAHASAALLEEQLCLSNSEHCGKQVSRSEVAARVYEGKNRYALACNEGGAVSTALRYYISSTDKRVCLNKYAQNPFDVGDGENLKLLRELYREFIESQSQDETLNERHLKIGFQNLAKFLERENRLWTYGNSASSMMTQEDLRDLLQDSKNEDEFAQNGVLFYCKDGRRSFDRRIPLETVLLVMKDWSFDPKRNLGDYKKVSVQPYVEGINEAKKNGHSLSLSVCYNSLLTNGKLVSGQRASELSEKGCGPHAIVVNSVRWDRQRNQCEVYVKNSHGANAILTSKWYNAELIFAHAFEMTYVKKK